MKMSMSGSLLSQVSFATEPSIRTFASTLAFLAALATFSFSSWANLRTWFLSLRFGVTFLRTDEQTFSKVEVIEVTRLSATNLS